LQLFGVFLRLCVSIYTSHFNTQMLLLSSNSTDGCRKSIPLANVVLAFPNDGQFYYVSGRML